MTEEFMRSLLTSLQRVDPVWCWQRDFSAYRAGAIVGTALDPPSWSTLIDSPDAVRLYDPCRGGGRVHLHSPNGYINSEVWGKQDLVVTVTQDHVRLVFRCRWKFFQTSTFTGDERWIEGSPAECETSLSIGGLTAEELATEITKLVRGRPNKVSSPLAAPHRLKLDTHLLDNVIEFDADTPVALQIRRKEAAIANARRIASQQKVASELRQQREQRERDAAALIASIPKRIGVGFLMGLLVAVKGGILFGLLAEAAWGTKGSWSVLWGSLAVSGILGFVVGFCMD